MDIDWSLLLERRLPYWVTVLLLWWLVTFQALWMCDKVFDDFNAKLSKQLFGFAEDNHSLYGSATALVGVIALPLVFAGLWALLLTSRALPPDSLACLNKILAPIFTRLVKIATPMISAVRDFRRDDAEYGRELTKHNQFLRGEANFEVIGFLLGFVPAAVNFGWLVKGFEWADEAVEETGASQARERLWYASINLGWAGTIPLFWFLIPVARHSVMLAVMGWSPVHALRIHVWSGYTSFVLLFLHGLGCLIVYLKYDTQNTLADHFFPAKQCWGKDAYNALPYPEVENAPQVAPEHELCNHAWYNMTGTLSLFGFIVLWAMSINWVRRRYYRLFYITHICFGTVMLVFAFLHFSFIAFYSAPSILLYLGSTIPTLVQALAARFRRGHRIVKVVSLHDAGGCMEVHVAVDEESSFALKTVPCPFVKLFVPSISMVWHPFSVFQKEGDNESVRFLFRRVGPYTNALATKLEYERPIVILDGFYRGSDRHLEATQHDRVSIICGGVAITPYLSLIPRIFRAMKERDRDNGRLSNLNLLWACREQGLMDYVLENYVQSFIAMSKEIDNFEFKIKIFHTGSSKSTKSDATLMIDESTKQFSSNDSSDTSEDKKNDNAAEGVEGDIEGKRTDIADIIIDDGEDSVNLVSDEKQINSGSISAGTGIDMELARFMPLRFPKIWQNVAIFLIFNGYIYLGLHWLSSAYNHDAATFAGMGKMTWVAILMVPLAACFGVLSETLFFFLKGKLPQVKEETYIFCNVHNGKVASQGKLADHTIEAIEIFKGRPTAEDLFEDAKNAACPGIFLCAPVPLSQMVWKEARKENTVLGFTRYCIYEEPFEM